MEIKVKIGDKVKCFDDGIYSREHPAFEDFIGHIGVVKFIDYEDNDFRVEFKTPYHDYWYLPLYHPLARPYKPFKNKLK